MKIYQGIIFISLVVLSLTKISFASLPKNVKISNVTQSQWTVSWITDVDEIGYIRWGTNTESLNELGIDERDTINGTPTIKDAIHHITVNSSVIRATTTYYYKIFSGTHTFDIASITTGAEILLPSISEISGYVYKWGPLLVRRVIVYLRLEKGTPSETSALRSKLTSAEGFWAEPLGNFRVLDLSASFNPDDNDNLYLYVEGANDGTASLTLKISDSKPTQDIIISPDTTPPAIPIITDDGTYTASSSELHAKWVSTDTESGIIEYQYAIGTTQGGTDTVDWTSVGTDTKITKTGLTLSPDKIYYFSVKAKDRVGLWSDVGYSDGIKIGYSPHLPFKIPVYPNPFLLSQGQKSITFGGLNERLTKEVTIKIFTIAGELVQQIERTDCNGQIEWTPPRNLASGIYIYQITNSMGEQVKGKLGLIK